MFGIKVIVRGYEHIDRHQPYVYVANHASMFDIPTVLVALHGKVNFVFKKELTRYLSGDGRCATDHLL